MTKYAATAPDSVIKEQLAFPNGSLDSCSHKINGCAPTSYYGSAVCEPGREERKSMHTS